MYSYRAYPSIHIFLQSPKTFIQLVTHSRTFKNKCTNSVFVRYELYLDSKQVNMSDLSSDLFLLYLLDTINNNLFKAHKNKTNRFLQNWKKILTDKNHHNAYFAQTCGEWYTHFFFIESFYNYMNLYSSS